MVADRSFKLLFQFSVLAMSLLVFPFLAAGQETPKSPPIGSAPSGRTIDAGDLEELVRDLGAEIRDLNSRLDELRDEEQRDRAETRELRARLNRAEGRFATDGVNESDVRPEYAATSEPMALTQAAQRGGVGSENQDIEQRLAKLEEDQQLDASKINEQSQTKVESGSKYRLRLSGIVLMDMFDNRGTVDDQDFAEIAMQSKALDSAGTFGGGLRQSQIGIEGFGPVVAGAHTSAAFKFDFAGGFPSAPNGISLGVVRLRTGTIRLDWANTSIVAGQDELFFAPLAPTSLASLAVPALSYSGNLWSWTPQIRIEHRFGLPNRSTLLLQGGMLDSLSGEAPQSPYQRLASWGERSGQPAYAARLSWSLPAFEENLTIGAGGYYGRQYWGLGRNVDGWASTLDVIVPLGNLFEFSGQFYRGRAVGGLNGAIGQDVLLSGPLGVSTSTVQGLDSMGGWVQLKFKPVANFEVNGAFGQDSPFANELERFPNTPTFYGTLLSRNLSPFVNFVYQVRSNVLFSAEYRYLKTFVLNGTAATANHTTLSLGYVF